MTVFEERLEPVRVGLSIVHPQTGLTLTLAFQIDPLEFVSGGIEQALANQVHPAVVALRQAWANENQWRNAVKRTVDAYNRERNKPEDGVAQS